MESTVPAALSAITLNPNIKEIEDMAGLLQKIMKNPEISKVGIVKIKPPPKAKVKPLVLPESFELKKCVTQSLTKVDDKLYRLEFTKKDQLTAQNFHTQVKKFEKNYQARKPVLEGDQIEDFFWTNNERADVDGIDPIYAIDNAKSLFPDEHKYFNLNKITSVESIIHGTCEIPGVTTPYLNVGMRFTCFGAHVEDSNLASININLKGEAKQWYVVPSTHAKQLADFVQSKQPKNVKCDLIIRHKTTLIAPSMLQKMDIPFAKVIQEEGDIIITMYGAYHQGFNHGLNFCESVNFATEEWIPHFQQTELCSCSYSDGPRYLHNELEKIIKDYKRHSQKEKAKSCLEKPATKSREIRPHSEIRYDCVDHWAKYDEEGSRSICKLEGCSSLSNIYCTKCNVHLCLRKNKNCFYLFHVLK